MYKYIERDTVRGYTVDDSGLLAIVSVPCINGQVCDNGGCPVTSDGVNVDLTGWPDTKAESYDNGALLVALDD